MVKAIPDASISFEVFADDIETMAKEAEILKQYGENVFVKIPVVNTQGESMIPLIKNYQKMMLKLMSLLFIQLNKLKK